MRTRLNALAALLTLSLVGADAFAFCRTTTCNPAVACSDDPERCCVLDAEGCDVNGSPVVWRDANVRFHTHAGGSQRLRIGGVMLAEEVQIALQRWLSSSCSQGRIALEVINLGSTELQGTEFLSDLDVDNSNVWSFFDEANDDASEAGFALDISTVAVTTVTINARTSSILDVDVELLSGATEFTTGEHEIDVDLASIVMHEAGHFLGLDHSESLEATMWPEYETGSVSQRDLSIDDTNAICAAYANRGIHMVGNDAGTGGSQLVTGPSGCQWAAAPVKGGSHGWAILAILALVTLSQRVLCTRLSRCVVTQ